jgi:ubiquinone/menaquinone biosynthesis C-methylase UbiE
LIQHLKTPETTINEMRRVLKDGKPLVIVETDWTSLTFYNEHFGIERKITGFLTEEKINNGFAAKNLTAYVEKAGFRDINLEIFPFIINTLKDANEYLWIEMMVQEAAKAQRISPEERDAFIAALHDADTKGYFSCSINVIIVTSIK